MIFALPFNVRLSHLIYPLANGSSLPPFDKGANVPLVLNVSFAGV